SHLLDCTRATLRPDRDGNAWPHGIDQSADGQRRRVRRPPRALSGSDGPQPASEGSCTSRPGYQLPDAATAASLAINREVQSSLPVNEGCHRRKKVGKSATFNLKRR